MKDLRIASLLPSATELACSLGLADRIVAISHECDYPPEILDKPVVVHGALPFGTMSPGEIDTAVRAQFRAGESLYRLDESLLRDLAPTHILTQDLCQICAPAGNEVARVLKVLGYTPEIVWMSPHSIADIHNDLRNLAAVTGTGQRAEALIRENHSRIQKIAASIPTGARRPRVFCAEWVDPIFCCGHWVPEQVEIAGGLDVLGRKWKDSARVSPDEVVAADPDLIVVMPCGFGLEECAAQATQLASNPTLRNLRAVQEGKIHSVEAALFSRPSLRVIDGAELLSSIFWPESRESLNNISPRRRAKPRSPVLAKTWSAIRS